MNEECSICPQRVKDFEPMFKNVDFFGGVVLLENQKYDKAMFRIW